MDTLASLQPSAPAVLRRNQVAVGQIASLIAIHLGSVAAVWAIELGRRGCLLPAALRARGRAFAAVITACLRSLGREVHRLADGASNTTRRTSDP